MSIRQHINAHSLVKLNSTQLKFIKTGSRKAKRDTWERTENKQTNKTTKIDDIKAVKQTPQIKINPVTVSVHVL